MHRMAFLGGRFGSLSPSYLFFYHILLVAAGFGRYIFYYVEAQNMVMNAPTFNDSAFTCAGYPEVLGLGYCLYPNGSTSYLELLNSKFNKNYLEQSARITYNEKVAFYEGNIEASFNSVLIFQINDLAAPNVMGSGLAMVISPYASPPNGSQGDGLGILNYNRNNGSSSQGLDTRTVALEFDTYMSPNIDVNPVPHLGIDLNSLVSIWSEAVSYTPGQIMGLWLDYNATLQIMNLWLQPVTDTTGAAPRPQNPLFSFTAFRLAAYIQARSYIALTSSASASKGEQNWIYYWSFQTTGFPPPSQSLGGWLQTWFGKMSPAMRRKIIAGVSVGAMALLCCLLACCYVCCRRRRRRKKLASQELGPVKKKISILSKLLVLMKLKSPEKPPKKRIRDSLSVATPLWDPAKPDSEDKSPLLQAAVLGSQEATVEEKKENGDASKEPQKGNLDKNAEGKVVPGNTETKIALSKVEDSDDDDTDKSSVEKDKTCGPCMVLRAKFLREKEKPWQGESDPGNRTVRSKKPTTEGDKVISPRKVPAKAIPLMDASLLDLEEQQGLENQEPAVARIPDKTMEENWRDDVETEDIVDGDLHASAIGISETLAAVDANEGQESSLSPDELLSSIPHKFDASSLQELLEANLDVAQQEKLSAVDNALEARQNQSLPRADVAEEILDAAVAIPETAEVISKAVDSSSKPPRAIDAAFPSESPVSAEEVSELDSTSPGDVSTAPKTFQEEESVVGEVLTNMFNSTPHADARLNSKFPQRIAFPEAHTRQPLVRSRISPPRKDPTFSSQQTAVSPSSQNISAANARRHTPPLPQSLRHTSSRELFGNTLPKKRSQLPSLESSTSSQTPFRSASLLSTRGPLKIESRTRKVPPHHFITPKQPTLHEQEVYRWPSLDQASSSSRKRSRPDSPLQPPVLSSALPQRPHSPKQEFLPGKHFDESFSPSPRLPQPAPARIHPLPQQLLYPREPILSIPQSPRWPSPQHAYLFPPGIWLEPQWPLQPPALPTRSSPRPPVPDDKQVPFRAPSKSFSPQPASSSASPRPSSIQMSCLDLQRPALPRAPSPPQPSVMITSCTDPRSARPLPQVDCVSHAHLPKMSRGDTPVCSTPCLSLPNRNLRPRSPSPSPPQRCVSPPLGSQNEEASFSHIISTSRRSQRHSPRSVTHRSQEMSLRMSVSRSPTGSASRSPGFSPPK